VVLALIVLRRGQATTAYAKSSIVSSGRQLFVEDLTIAGKRVITRVDFNVPVKGGEVKRFDLTHHGPHYSASS
jgi:hypothetical protein